jgi:hypothetical protein
MTDFVRASQREPILRQIEALYHLASHTQATMIMMPLPVRDPSSWLQFA